MGSRRARFGGGCGGRKPPRPRRSPESQGRRGIRRLPVRRRRFPEDTDLGSVTERLERVTRILGSDAAVADLLAVSRAQPRRWREGQRPDPENRDRIIGLDAVIALLSGFLAESSIPKWLTGVNAHLDNRRPISVLRERRIADVIAAIEAQKGGAYA